MLKKCLILICLCPAILIGQPVVYTPNEGWFGGLNAGVASFFGDLSIYDYSPKEKLTLESSAAAGITAGKHITKFIIAELNLTKGGLKGSNPSLGLAFNGTILEFSANGYLNFTRLVFPNSEFRTSVYAMAGTGVIAYRATKTSLSDQSVVETIGRNEAGDKDGHPAGKVIFPAGISLSYQFNERWSLRSDFAYRLTTDDRLDAHAGSTSVNDRYTILMVGMRFMLRPLRKIPAGPLPCPQF
ncbi:MAG TPA: hypothetical protein PLV51_00780 [Lentimicrobium sp.]|nr:hypothetical protein [Lentimicrobium sp.]